MFRPDHVLISATPSSDVHGLANLNAVFSQTISIAVLVCSCFALWPQVILLTSGSVRHNKHADFPSYKPIRTQYEYDCRLWRSFSEHQTVDPFLLHPHLTIPVGQECLFVIWHSQLSFMLSPSSRANSSPDSQFEHIAVYVIMFQSVATIYLHYENGNACFTALVHNASNKHIHSHNPDLIQQEYPYHTTWNTLKTCTIRSKSGAWLFPVDQRPFLTGTQVTYVVLM